jgi:hypothetical protein
VTLQDRIKMFIQRKDNKDDYLLFHPKNNTKNTKKVIIFYIYNENKRALILYTKDIYITHK